MNEVNVSAFLTLRKLQLGKQEQNVKYSPPPCWKYKT